MARNGEAPTTCGPRVVITAGPTREWLDDVRFLSNASTGRMGIELARAARARGAAVTLVLGPTAERPPAGVEVVPVETTRDLLHATRRAAGEADLVFFAAAPSDFRPVSRREGKPAREGGAFALELEPTEDVAKALGDANASGNAAARGDAAGRRPRVHVGFALEVTGGVARAREKMAAKHFDAIVLNGPANFGDGGGEVAWILPHAEPERLPASSKRATARAIVARAWRLLEAR